jgi:hypothetical protein
VSIAQGQGDLGLTNVICSQLPQRFVERDLETLLVVPCPVDANTGVFCPLSIFRISSEFTMTRQPESMPD